MASLKMTTQKNWYYKIIDNETGETECYVKVSGHIKPEALCEIIGIERYHHAVEITEDEYQEN